MTGYGRKETGGDAGHFTIEIRSVNNRYIDVQVKVPRGLSLLELRVKKTVQERCSRGRFDVLVTRNSDREKATRLVVDDVLAGQYVGLLRDLKTRYGLAGEVDLSLVAGMQNVITMTEVTEDLEAIWALLATGVATALDELDRMRLDEGAALVRDINGRINAIEDGPCNRRPVADYGGKLESGWPTRWRSFWNSGRQACPGVAFCRTDRCHRRAYASGQPSGPVRTRQTRKRRWES
jgi:uncharacterized protein (TIGR00255 family)